MGRWDRGLIEHDPLFWRWVDKQGPRWSNKGCCWVWTGSLDKYGYGQLNRRGRVMRAHRYAWVQLGGVLTPGLTLDHLCRNHSCVRPSHLEEVTLAENLRRQVRRPSPTHCPAGHDYAVHGKVNRKGATWCYTCQQGKALLARRARGVQPRKTISEELSQEIWMTYWNGTTTQAQLAATYELSLPTIGKIVHSR